MTQTIANNETYKKILADSFGGVMYSNKPEDYDYTELLQMWQNLPEYKRTAADGIMKGVMQFLEGK